MLNILFTNTCDLYSFEDIQDGYITKKEEVLVQENVTCKYRKGSLTTIDNGVPIVNSTHTLITGTDFQGKEGDRVVVRLSDDTIVVLRLGEKFTFSAIPHFEFACERVGVV